MDTDLKRTIMNDSQTVHTMYGKLKSSDILAETQKEKNLNYTVWLQ